MKKDRKRIRRKAVRRRPREIERWTQALSSAEEFLQVSPEPLDAPHLLLGVSGSSATYCTSKESVSITPMRDSGATTGNRSSAPSTVPLPSVQLVFEGRF
jgi:hypothetical protein